MKSVSLADHCKRLVDVHGTYQKAGEALGIDPSTIHHFITGKRTMPRPEMLKALGLEVKYFPLANKKTCG